MQVPDLLSFCDVYCCSECSFLSWSLCLSVRSDWNLYLQMLRRHLSGCFTHCFYEVWFCRWNAGVTHGQRLPRSGPGAMAAAALGRMLGRRLGSRRLLLLLRSPRPSAGCAAHTGTGTPAAWGGGKGVPVPAAFWTLRKGCVSML